MHVALRFFKRIDISGWHRLWNQMAAFPRKASKTSAVVRAQIEPHFHNLAFHSPARSTLHANPSRASGLSRLPTSVGVI